MVQEEIRQKIRDGVTSKYEENDIFSLVGKEKGKKTQRKIDTSHNNVNKKDLRKIKCFHWHGFRHYATKCPHKKSKKKPSGGVGGEKLSSKFELDFTLIAYMANIVMGSVWYLDSSASFDMKICK